MSRVKICGITNLEDALHAISCGADALGFVFYEKSPRYISPHQAKTITDQLPPFVERVGLFVNASSDFIDAVCFSSGMSLAQIHFEADETLYHALKTKHIKVIRARSQKDIERYAHEYRLIDAFVEGYGGEGKRLDLSWFDTIDCSKIILAGGLNSDNLSEVLPYNFYGLDVSSGVEQRKGKKDPKKVADFIQGVHHSTGQ
jgi:phosphoribosylanthranilate isomerase